MLQKIYGWTLIIVCASIVIVFIALFPVAMQRFDFSDFSTYLTVSSILFLAFLVYLLAIGFVRGIEKIKSSNYFEGSTEFTDNLNLRLGGKISLRDYRISMLAMAFMRPRYIFMVLIAVTFIFNFSLNDDAAFDTAYIVFFGAFLLLPLISVVQLHKSYKSNKALNTHLTYELNNTSLTVNGESVNATLYWNHFNKVKETGNFFLLYQGEGVATFIDKKLFNKSELETFRRFLRSLPIRKI